MIQPLTYPFTIRRAADSVFCSHVNNLIVKSMGDFEKNTGGPNRQFLKMDYVSPSGDPVLFAMKERLAFHFELGPYVTPPTLKDFIGYITEGGAIHPHVDSDLVGKRHVRINVLVSQPLGCIPLMEDIPIAVEVGDAWLNLASKVLHATTPVEGPGFRSAVSFGYQIDPRRGDELLAIHKQWVRDLSPLVA